MMISNHLRKNAQGAAIAAFSAGLGTLADNGSAWDITKSAVVAGAYLLVNPFGNALPKGIKGDISNGLLGNIFSQFALNGGVSPVALGVGGASSILPAIISNFLKNTPPSLSRILLAQLVGLFGEQAIKSVIERMGEHIDDGMKCSPA